MEGDEAERAAEIRAYIVDMLDQLTELAEVAGDDDLVRRLHAAARVANSQRLSN